jgi:hypothetical protein
VLAGGQQQHIQRMAECSEMWGLEGKGLLDKTETHKHWAQEVRIAKQRTHWAAARSQGHKQRLEAGTLLRPALPEHLEAQIERLILFCLTAA